MPWGKVDDQFYDHPKVLPLTGSLEGLAALGLWALALSYSNRHLTDGNLNRSRLGRIVDIAPGDLDALVDLLVEVPAGQDSGLWEVAAGPGALTIHDYLDHNDARADVLRRREAEAQRMRDLRARARGEVVRGSPHPGRAPERAPEPTPARTGARGTERTAERTSRPRSGARAPASRPPGGDSRPGPAGPVPPPSLGLHQRSPTPSRAGAHATAEGDHLQKSSTTDDAGWSDFTEPEWAPFIAAWLARGFRRPPIGSPDEDPAAPDASQRARLWRIADARPSDLGTWVREAPGRTARDVVGFVFDRWNALEAEVAALPEERGSDADPSPAEARAIVSRTGANGIGRPMPARPAPRTEADLNATEEGREFIAKRGTEERSPSDAFGDDPLAEELR